MLRVKTRAKRYIYPEPSLPTPAKAFFHRLAAGGSPLAFDRKLFASALLAGFLAGAALTGTVLGIVALDQHADQVERDRAADEAQSTASHSRRAATDEPTCDRAGWPEARGAVLGLTRLNVTGIDAWDPRWVSPFARLGPGDYDLDRRNRTLHVSTQVEETGYAAFLVTHENETELLLVGCKSLNGDWLRDDDTNGMLLLIAHPYMLIIQHIDPNCPKKEVGPGGALERTMVHTGVLAGQSMVIDYLGDGACPEGTFHYTYGGAWALLQGAR